MEKRAEKSAKDKAFERERVKFQRRIRNLEQIVQSKDAEISSLREQINVQDTQIRSLYDWVDRLLEYTELSKEDMRKSIDKDAVLSDIFEMFSVTGNGRFL